MQRMSEGIKPEDSVAERKPIPGLSDEESRKAAELIQRTFRGHKQRRELKGYGLSASTRWDEALKDAKFKHITTPRGPVPVGLADDEGTALARQKSPTSPARSNWQRATLVARRAGQEDNEESDSSFSDSSDAPEDNNAAPNDSEAVRSSKKKTAKMMGLQYFLELVDHKHRHGSNLRKYHAKWQQQDTNQNFFYWLDEGDGKDLDLEECSRERLNKMQVRYLSREERQHYLVKVDAQGMLIWAKNGERVWTKDELFKDSLHGIVPMADPTPKFQYNVPPENQSSDTSDSGSSEDETTQADEGERYIDEDFHRARGPAKLKYVSSGVVFNHMMRSSLKKGHKWIFVCDTSFRWYIGYKQAGAFQHSSFLQGARVLAAGQIKVKRGQLKRLSPLSGHYRCKAANFRAFVDSLKENNVDMSHLSISRSYAVLVGLEAYTTTRRKIKSTEKAIGHQKDKVLHPDKVREEEEALKDKSRSAEIERQYLEQERLAREKTEQEAKANKSIGGRVSKLFKRMSIKDEEVGGVGGHTSEDHEISSSGLEHGASPPGGELPRR